MAEGFGLERGVLVDVEDVGGAVNETLGVKGVSQFPNFVGVIVVEVGDDAFGGPGGYFGDGGQVFFRRGHEGLDGIEFAREGVGRFLADVGDAHLVQDGGEGVGLGGVDGVEQVHLRQMLFLEIVEVGDVGDETLRYEDGAPLFAYALYVHRAPADEVFDQPRELGGA